MRHYFTKEQKQFVKENIKGREYETLLNMFNEHFGTNIKINQLRAFIKNNGFKSGVNAQFEKGKKPWNKGMKGLQTGGYKGWFKKGQVPVNHRLVGSERVNVDGYTEVKVAEPNVWKLKHRVLWEKENGTVPKSHAVIFGDGNRNNFDLDNLILVSRAQLATLNKHGLIQNDTDLTKTGIILADVYQKISERKKERMKTK